MYRYANDPICSIRDTRIIFIPKSYYSKETVENEEILNVIDQVRSEGISRYLGLPQLIVCGD